MRKGSKLGDERYESMNHQVDRAMKQADKNAEQGRLLIADIWFEVDAYGAAVSGILKSIELGLKSGSLGQGMEEDTLRRVLYQLLKEDPYIKREEWMG